MKISLIAAMARNRVIGKNNRLPWKLPADMAWFKKITMDHPVIMGRATYQSIGRPLPGRKNIILTREKDFKVPGCLVVASIDDALNVAQSSDEVFVIGGAQVYAQFLLRADRIYLTLIEQDFEGDAFFPEFNAAQWRKVSDEPGVVDAANLYPHRFLIFERI